MLVLTAGCGQAEEPGTLSVAICQDTQAQWDMAYGHRGGDMRSALSRRLTRCRAEGLL